jgi:purine-cytosine permease-like protein
VLFGIGLFGQLLTTSWLFFLGLQLSSAPYTEHHLDIGVLFLAYGMNLLCFVLVAPAIRWGYYHAKK